MTPAGVALVLRCQSHPQSGVATGPMARSNNVTRRATQLTTARTAVERSTTLRARLESQLLRRCSMIVPRTSPHAAPNFQHRSLQRLDRLLRACRLKREQLAISLVLVVMCQTLSDVL